MSLMEEFSSRRRIDFLTPGSFLKKIIVISTVMQPISGETAKAHIEALNYFHACEKLKYAEWEVIKKHKNYKEANKFHDEYVNSQTWNDLKR